ncbi:hypothetical protein LTR36_010415 [Oleoguttula mirabilis]|uniref:Uncharacterized protein n=1 Tax=Oleoguttula mirabilis TaxID=1507867 RepID=A0AAV9J469_9PEZI|nr:hypothetical protein LTR36_010415 [Oleoguttula mirabilis]
MAPRNGFGTRLTDYIKTNPRNAKMADFFYEPEYVCRATQTYPRFDLLLPGSPVSVDFEFQHFMRDDCKDGDRTGRAAVTNVRKDVILDVYAVYPREEGVRKMMPPEEPMDNDLDILFDNGAVPTNKVDIWIKEIVKNRTVIVHGG